jgi:hypothetical protein
MKKVHEKGFKNVIAMMSQHDCAAAVFARNAIEVASSQARAYSTKSATLWNFIDHYRVRVSIFDPVGYFHPLSKFWQNGRRKAWLTLI